MRVALVPLDERPVNTSLPAAVAAIAGVEVLLPPRPMLPSKRQPGDADAVADWVNQLGEDAELDAVVVSTDMLCYGGLIASRTSDDTEVAVARRLDHGLRALRRRRSDLPIAAVTLVMRATDSYSPEEEPEYWSEYGRELHALGAELHRGFEGDSAVAEDAKVIPAEVRADFLARRLRNHVVNLEVLGLAAAGVVDPLLITADDTAVHAAGSLEQIWLRQWTAALQPSADVLMYPGADEVGAVLVARSLTSRDAEPVKVAIACAEGDEGLARVAPYENNPVLTTVTRQIEAAGGVIVTEAPDFVVVVHAPRPGDGDWVRGAPEPAREGAAAATADLVGRELAAGHRVVLADVCYPNGADPRLVDHLVARRLLLELTAYAGWNTAGNTIGTVVAAGVATVLGHRWGSFDPVAARAFLLHRLVEDYGYQAVARTELVRDLPLRNDRPSISPEREAGYIDDATARLRQCLAELSPADAERFVLEDVSLPWHRSFEIDFVIRSTS